MKKIIHGKEARDKLIEGVTLVYDAVSTTLGPKSRNVILTRNYGLPIVVHDGVTISREVQHPDEFINTGALLTIEAAHRTNMEAGDGTTTSTVLTYILVREGMKMIEAGVNPIQLRDQLNAAAADVVRHLEKLTTKTKSVDDIKRVAFISSTSKQIGDLVGSAVLKVGLTGLITVDESGTPETYTTYTEGMEIPTGMMAPHFITSPQRMEAIIDDPHIAVVGKKITAPGEIVPLLEYMLQKNKTKSMVFFGDIGGDALRTIIQNKSRGVIQALVVKPPGHGEQYQNALDDIALVTGATVFSDQLGMNSEQFVKEFDEKLLGRAKRVQSGADSTVIVEGVGERKYLDERVKSLTEKAQTTDKQYVREMTEERIARLTSGVAIIKVGAKTVIELREKVERVKDAVGAARAALEEGIVAGGGITYLRLGKKLDKKNKTPGEELLVKALMFPFQKILENAGEDSEHIGGILADIGRKGENFGYEMTTGILVDMIEAGVIDPAKVVRLALLNAVSVSGSILTAECIIADENKKEEPSE